MCYDIVSMGSRDSSAVRASYSRSKGPRFESWQERRDNFLLRGQLSVLNVISVYLFHCRATAVACKISQSFCQKCRWQVTAKRTYTLPMWLWMKWQCKPVHSWMVYTELRLDSSISHGTSHATTKQHDQHTTSVDINNMHYKMIQPLFQNHVRHVHSESAQEQRTVLCKHYK